MINLLPPKEKEGFTLEIKKNLFITLGGIVLICLISLILVLFSLKFYILGEVNSRKIIFDQQEKRYQTPDFLLYKGIMQNYNDDLSKIRSFLNREIYFNDVLKNILEIKRPQGLYFTGLSLNRDDSGKIKVIILGFSNSRENILLFRENIRENIQKSDKINNLYFSPDSWIKAANSNFSVSFDFLPSK